MSRLPALDLITLGEGMVQFGARTKGPLRQVRTYDVHAAGSELNVAIGAARLGLRVGWISRLGADDFGDLLLAAVRAEGVDTSQVVRDGADPTGIFVVQRGYPVEGHSSSIYYRAGSAGSRLSVAELDVDYLRRTAIFHTTGISLAVSAELAEAAATAGATAAASGARRSFDVNYRAKLWSPDEARPSDGDGTGEQRHRVLQPGGRARSLGCRRRGRGARAHRFLRARPRRRRVRP